MNKTCPAALLIFMLLLAPIPAVQAQTPQQTLTQYVADLQKSPNDYALREKIIRHVQAMKPVPAVPEEARKYVNRGMAAAEGAKTESDYKDAIAEFQKAVNIAPWVGAGYRGLAVMQDKAGQYTQALQNLKLFVLTNPPAADADAAKTLMDKIEYRQEKAAKESSPAAIAAQEQKKFDELLKKMDGRRYKAPPVGPYRYVVDVQGKMLVFGRLFQNDPEPYRFPNCSYIAIQGRVSKCSYHDNEWGFIEYTQTISEDGNRITRHIRYRGKVDEIIYMWP